MPSLAQAQERVQGVVFPEAMDKFGRVIFEFDKIVKHEIEMTPGVLVLRLDEAVQIDLSQLPDRMSRYVGAARLDPDGRAVRLALSQAVVINKMEAGEKIFIDMLPPTWQGLPPPLPSEVVAELARRAEAAERKAFLEEERKRRLANAPKMAIRVSEAPTFSRISFIWSTDVEATISRERDEVKILFNTEIEPDISRLTGQPPKELVSAKWERVDGGTIILLEVNPDVQLRSFREEKSHVIDLSPPLATLADDSFQKQIDILELGDESQEGGAQKDIFSLDTRKPVASAVGSNQAATQDIMVSTSQQPLDAQNPFETVSEGQEASLGKVTPINPTAQSNPVAVQSNPNLSSPVATNSAALNPVAANPVSSNPVATNPETASAQSTSPVFGQQGSGALNPTLSNVMPVVDQATELQSNRGTFQEIGSVRIGNSLRLSFPFEMPTPAAVFQRAGRLWMLFESSLPMDSRSLRGKTQNFLTDIDVQRIGDVQLITGTFVRPALVTASKSNNDWLITIGDMILEPTQPIALVRGQRQDGGSLMAADAEGIGNVHWFEDDLVGDRLAVVTMVGPSRGFLKDQSFVEFEALSTAHGMTFRPKTEDISVRLSVNQVVISREDGLTLSGGGVQQYVPGRRSVGYGARSGQLEYTELVASNPRIFFQQMSKLMLAAAKAEPEEKSIARMDVARFLVANNYINEALGVMRMASNDDPLLEQDPAFNIVRGVASTLAGRVSEAKADLSVHGLDRDPDAALWRAIVAVEEGNFRAAQLLMEEGKFALNSYPAHVRVRFHLAAVEADIATNDIASAILRLEVLETETLDEDRRAEARLHRARVFEMMGRSEDALALYTEGTKIADGPVRAESILLKTNLEHRLGKTSLDDAIETLERLALSWRGDDIEINTLRSLGDMYIEAKNPRRAFQVLKDAVVADEGSEFTRLFQDEMSRAFVSYFLGEQSMEQPALDALALYYDFKEMTPIGRQGDEIIRRLSDRLVEVDLLEQAANLLEYQIDKRLRGAGRSQVAARLAYVHLLNKSPEKALNVLQRTRQSVLPEQLQKERNLLEARALSDLGRTALASELLKIVDGAEADKLLADTLWLAKRWQETGEHIETMLADGWQTARPLTASERYEVLRGAIAFALAGDDLGLDRFRTKFLAKMSNSPDANAFAVVTSPINTASSNFQTVAREIANVDTLEAFLNDFRERYGYAQHKARREEEEAVRNNDPDKRADANP